MLVSLNVRESSRYEVLDTLTALWESFQVGRALSLSLDVVNIDPGRSPWSLIPVAQ